MFIRNRLLSGASITRAAEADAGADTTADTGADKAADKAAETIDPVKYQGLASAHDRLKKDAAADRAAKAALEARVAEFEAKEAEKAEEAARAAGDFDTVKKQLEARYGKEVETRDGTITKQRTQIEKLVIDAGLSQALAAAAVKPEFMSAVTALLRQGVEIRDDDEGNPVAYRSGVPLGEAVKLWAENDGKAFINLNNSGGDAKGGRGTAGGKTMSLADFNKLDPKTAAARMADGLVITD
jgi:hypothetical protein